MENKNKHPEQSNKDEDSMLRGIWRSPLGVFAVMLTTVSVTLMLIGLAADLLGLIKNPYVGIFVYTLLPSFMVFGLLLLPLAAWLRHRKWRRTGLVQEPLILNLGNPRHRYFLVGFVSLSVLNLALLAVAGYEGYHCTDTPYFCGMVCHKVMAPEYSAYKRSPHSRVSCVECHIGSGAAWFVRAKISGFRQVYTTLINSYDRPIPVPVEQLRPARDTCENCHWPEKFYGKKVKRFVSFTNDNQLTPEITEVALHIGGHNRETGSFEGIHWHVSKDVEVKYLAANRERTRIARVKVKRPDGSEDEFIKSDVEVEEGFEPAWRVMDCIDCHNRPTHIMELPDQVVDLGLLNGRIDQKLTGIREDSLAVLTMDYDSQAGARENLVENLVQLQQKRDPAAAKKNIEAVRNAGAYLLEKYLGNVWPEQKIFWGTYKQHLGHRFADEGYGCWRCHDDEHSNKSGETISQDCDLCHDEPE